MTHFLEWKFVSINFRHCPGIYYFFFLLLLWSASSWSCSSERACGLVINPLFGKFRHNYMYMRRNPRRNLEMFLFRSGCSSFISKSSANSCAPAESIFCVLRQQKPFLYQFQPKSSFCDLIQGLVTKIHDEIRWRLNGCSWSTCSFQQVSIADWVDDIITS